MKKVLFNVLLISLLLLCVSCQDSKEIETYTISFKQGNTVVGSFEVQKDHLFPTTAQVKINGESWVLKCGTSASDLANYGCYYLEKGTTKLKIYTNSELTNRLSEVASAGIVNKDYVFYLEDN